MLLLPGRCSQKFLHESCVASRERSRHEFRVTGWLGPMTLETHSECILTESVPGRWRHLTEEEEYGFLSDPLCEDSEDFCLTMYDERIQFTNFQNPHKNDTKRICWEEEGAQEINMQRGQGSHNPLMTTKTI